MINESTKCTSIILTETEKIESNLYVCYERTQYHYFKRNNGVNNFSWLFADRIFGFKYSEGNEPLLPLVNGFQRMINSLQEHYSINPNDLKALLEDKFSNGYQAFSLLTVCRPDGSSFNTSTLYEGISGNTVFYTQTGWLDLVTCLPIQMEELLNRIPLNSKGQIDIWFLKAPVELIQRLKKTGVSLLNEILINCYGYHLENNELIGPEKSVLSVQTEGLAMLVSFLSNPDNLFREGKITKRNQLRMHKHISNKMRPTLFAWKGIIECSECRSTIGELEANSFSAQIAQCEHIIDELFKWTSVVNATLNYKHYARYLEELNRLQAEYNIFQDIALKQMKLIIGAIADSQNYSL